MQQNGALVLKLQHFSSRLGGWEEQGWPIKCKPTGKRATQIQTTGY